MERTYLFVVAKLKNGRAEISIGSLSMNILLEVLFAKHEPVGRRPLPAILKGRHMLNPDQIKLAVKGWKHNKKFGMLN